VKSRMNERKYDHLRILAEDPQTDRKKSYFDSIRLKPKALPQIDLDDVDTATRFMGKNLSFPLLISCMTGGSGDELCRINRNLAVAAEATGVAMGMGSQRVMLADPSAAESFMLRRYAPDILLFGNLGAVQLNNGITVDDCRKLVELSGIDGLYLHLNPLQEAVQPEGDTNFSNITERIRDVVDALDVPILVKEVGAGIGAEDAELLLAAGVQYIDVAGSGGTSWSRIESHRAAESSSTGIVFQDWGLPTPQALRELQPICRDRATLIASGGIRSGIDMVKSILLGASLCGIARPFIEYAEESPEAVIGYINNLKREFKTAMFLLGIKDVESLINTGYGVIYE